MVDRVTEAEGQCITVILWPMIGTACHNCKTLKRVFCIANISKSFHHLAKYFDQLID